MKTFLKILAIGGLCLLAFSTADKPITLHITFSESVKLWQGLQDSKIILAHSDMAAYQASMRSDSLSMLQGKIAAQISAQMDTTKHLPLAH